VTCTRLVDRLYDDDSRDALERGGEPPPDLSGHVEACASCRSEWLAALADAVAIPRSLAEAAPPQLSDRIRLEMRAQLAAAAVDWRSALSWSATAGIYAAAALRLADGSLPAAWCAAAFVTTALLTCAVKLTREGLGSAG
jgi:hypothetical protein